MNRLVQVRGGADFAVALTAKDGVWAWGSDGSGELGAGRITGSHIPVRVRLPRQVRGIAEIRAGNSFALALTSTGHVWAWGDGQAGDLGDGKTSNAFVPVQVATPAKIAAISTGCLHSLALTNGGEVLAWGNNKYGELGTSPAGSASRPTRVANLTGKRVTAIAVGCFTSYAKTASGHVLAWGLNDSGELGDGNFDDAFLPVQSHLPAGDTAAAVDSGPASSAGYAITTRN
jgi:alpha-tubulin suppressor-like RCC1 family protein